MQAERGGTGRAERRARSWQQLVYIVFKVGNRMLLQTKDLLMIESPPPPPNSRALLPTFLTNCANGSHFAQMGSHFAQNTTLNPCSLLSCHTPLSGICTYTKHPQPHSNPFGVMYIHKTPPTPQQNTPFPGIKIVQNEVLSGQPGPQLGKMFEMWTKLF